MFAREWIAVGCCIAAAILIPLTASLVTKATSIKRALRFFNLKEVVVWYYVRRLHFTNQEIEHYKALKPDELIPIQPATRWEDQGMKVSEKLEELEAKKEKYWRKICELHDIAVAYH